MMAVFFFIGQPQTGAYSCYNELCLVLMYKVYTVLGLPYD